MREADGCVQTVPRLTSVERTCFYRFVIRHGWVFAVIVEAIFIRNSFFQIQIKQYEFISMRLYKFESLKKDSACVI